MTFTTHRPSSEEAAVASASPTAACANHHLSNMAFMMKKKRYKFQVDLCLDEMVEVAYSKAILFAKIRQLDGGNFTDVSKR